jgi:hypothetical protein
METCQAKDRPVAENKTYTTPSPIASTIPCQIDGRRYKSLNAVARFSEALKSATVFSPTSWRQGKRHVGKICLWSICCT